MTAIVLLALAGYGSHYLLTKPTPEYALFSLVKALRQFLHFIWVCLNRHCPTTTEDLCCSRYVVIWLRAGASIGALSVTASYTLAEPGNPVLHLIL